MDHGQGLQPVRAAGSQPGVQSGAHRNQVPGRGASWLSHSPGSGTCLYISSYDHEVSGRWGVSTVPRRKLRLMEAKVKSIRS